MRPSLDPIAALAWHPIAVVAERTGLSQDVLRVWERRYGVVEPVRGPGGQRRYSDRDIERLQLLHAATRAGRSIGHVATLGAEALAALVADDVRARTLQTRPPEGSSATDAVIGEALAQARALDGPGLGLTLRRSMAHLGVSNFLELVAAPLLRLIGEEWHAGRLSPAPEHLVSSVVHDIIAGTILSLAPAADAPRMLVATPAGDRHAVGAALVAAAAAVEGWNVLYLGADLPADEIAAAARATAVRMVALSVVYVDDRDRVLGELRTLRTRLPDDVSLIVGGGGAGGLAGALGAIDVQVASSIPGLVAALRRDLVAA